MRWPRDTGQFYVEPDEQTLAKMQQKYDEMQTKKELLQTLKGKESVTLDGRKIMLYASGIPLPDFLLSAVQSNPPVYPLRYPASG